MVKLIFTQRYEKIVSKFLKKHPSIIEQYKKTLQLLELNPHHPSLRLHKLHGKLDGVHSVSINISYRITIEFIIQDDIIIPINVGTHDEVY